VTSGATGLLIRRLRCEHLHDPLGISRPDPRLSWELASDRPGAGPVAHRVLVASTAERLAADRPDLWDSGWHDGTAAHAIYGGRALSSGEEAHWRVLVTDEAGDVSASPHATWEAGLIGTAAWEARWISRPIGWPAGPDAPTTVLRRPFALTAPPRRARLHVTALGLYAASINGRRVGTARLTPGWTDYRSRVAVQTYDVVAELVAGLNVIEVELANGWYAGWVGLVGKEVYGTQPELLAQLVIELDDGSTQIVATDGHWSAAPSGRRTDLLVGEALDARAQPDRWEPVRLSEGTPATLVDTTAPAVHVLAELDTVAVTEPDPGVWIFDLGQNIAGWARLRVRGPRGTEVRLRFGEVLDGDGRLYTANLRTARATDRYTLAGDGDEVFEPAFTTHGFRYVEVTGCPGPPDASAITGIVAGNDLDATGTFRCSDPLVNRLHDNIVWGQRGNFLAVPTDCPQRDERLGWTGDAQVFVATACFTTDVSAFLDTWMHDMIAGQTDEGAFPVVAPRLEAANPDESDGAPGWGDAGVIVPWTLFVRYADARMLERCFPAMARWVDYVHAANPDLLWRNRRHGDMGDWLSVDADSPKEVIATSFFAWSASLVAAAARALGRTDDEARYADLAAEIRRAYQRAYVRDDGAIEGDTQTVHALALRFGLVPDELRPGVAARLVADVERRGWHLSTGFLGVAHLLPALTESGHVDVAYRLLHQETCPSWLYPVLHGATTIWERWDGWTEERGFHDPGMNSFNHYAFGAVGEWLYETVAGVRPDPERPGYEHVVIDPRPGGTLTWVEATYRSPRGEIAVRWDEHGLDVTIPPGVTATVLGREVGSGRHVVDWTGKYTP
jgi:alpha-L-rhamnosidase